MRFFTSYLCYNLRNNHVKAPKSMAFGQIKDTKGKYDGLTDLFCLLIFCFFEKLIFNDF